MGCFTSPAFTRIVGVDGFTPQGFRKLFERCTLLAAQKQKGVHVAHDGVRRFLIQGFELTLCLQNHAGGDLPAADGCNELVEVWDLPDVRKLIQQASHMNRKSAMVLVIGTFAQEVEKLGIDHANEKIERGVRVGHDEEQGCFLIAQGFQLQLVIGGDFPQLGDVKDR